MAGRRAGGGGGRGGGASCPHGSAGDTGRAKAGRETAGDATIEDTSDPGGASKSTAAREPDGTAVGAQPPLAAALYLVATPIGNAADITLRALRVLAGCDVIACEDTRVTRKLLAIHGIGGRRRSGPALVACHDHNEAEIAGRLVDRVTAGGRVALVADAGSPLVSDPGFRLVQRAIAAGIAVVPVPGASSVLAALAVAGLPTDRFLFAGFLPARQAARRREIAQLAPVPATLVLLEAPGRLAATLADLADLLGPRPAAVTRELTKLFEEVRRGNLDALAAAATAAPPPRGEVTLVIGPPAADAAAADAATIDRLLQEALAEATARDAVDRVAAATGLPRRQLYARALVLSGRRR